MKEMKEMKEAKKLYETVAIPAELEQMVEATLRSHHVVIPQKAVFDRNYKRRVYGSNRNTAAWSGMAAGVAFGALVIGLNTNSVFASAMQQNALLGPVAKVLTFRTYEEKDSDKAVYEKVPGVSIDEADVKETQLAQAVNQKIQEQCDAYVKDAITRVQDYKEAFLETGGTEAEFEQKNIQIRVDYEVLSQTADSVSFVVRGTESWVSAYAITEYYNLDLNSLKDITLKDLLGENYISIINDSIRAQIKEREAQDDSADFFSEEEGGFQGIDDTAKFYINADGNPVVVFDKYTIAPGYMGQVEFEIRSDSTSEQSAQDTEQNENTGSEYAAFAEKIRTAFDEKNLEELSDLMTYPAYLSLSGGIVVETKEDFQKLDADEVFASSMISMLDHADLSALTSYESGVTIGDGVPCITFQKNEDGTYGITGVNYVEESQ